MYLFVLTLCNASAFQLTCTPNYGSIVNDFVLITSKDRLYAECPIKNDEDMDIMIILQHPLIVELAEFEEVAAVYG